MTIANEETELTFCLQHIHQFSYALVSRSERLFLRLNPQFHLLDGTFQQFELLRCMPVSVLASNIWVDVTGSGGGGARTRRKAEVSKSVVLLLEVFYRLHMLLKR